MSMKPPIVMPERTWIPSTKQYQDIRICDGLNQGLNPLDIGPGQAVKLLNFVPFEYPTLTVREGFTQVGSTQAGHYITHVRKYADELVIGSKYGVYKQNGSVWDTIINNASPAERYWDMVQFDNTLIMADGLGKPSKYSGSSVTTLNDAPAVTKQITLHANRLFLVGADEPNVIRWSAYENIDNFNTYNGDNADPGFQPINSNVGEDISAIYTYRDRVVIFKKHSLHQLFGERGYDFDISNVSLQIGCIAPRTVIEINHVLYFLGHSGVYAFDGGASPVDPISDPVKPYIDALNWNHLDQCVSGTDGRRLFITLVTGASTVPNVTLMYDPQMRSETSTGWWVVDHVDTAYLEDGEYWYTATSDGKVRRMDDGDTDAGTPINYEIITKPIVIGDWHTKKRPHKFRVVADIPAGATMKVYYSPSTDGEDWTQVRELAPTTDVFNHKIIFVGQRSEWFRVKITGTGRPKIYSIAPEVK